MRIRKYRTWLDVKRELARRTNYGSNLPDGIVKLTCFSSALEVGIKNQDNRENASSILKSWFGDWYQESDQIIQLDIDDGNLPVEFIFMDNYSQLSPSIRPFWNEVAYLQNSEEFNLFSGLLPEPYKEKPEVITFYSFKGGVGRTLHLAAHVIALLERAKDLDRAVKILVIDSDLEAPGLTYWQAHEKQQATISFIDFLELYQYPSSSVENVFSIVAQEVRKTAKQQNKSTVYFLPAFIEEQDLLDTPILPENLVRNPRGSWEVGNTIYRLGKTLDVDYIFIDLRAGLSEISSPLLFDSRLQRFIVTTPNEQSIRGVSLVLEKIGYLAPSDSQIKVGNYYDPTVIISFLTPELRALPVFEETLVQLQSSYIQPNDDNLDTTRLDIEETFFEQQLLYINDWDEARARLNSTSIMKLARKWSEDRLFSNTPIVTDTNNPQIIDDIKRLKNICQRYIYAETGQGKDLLITESLQNLAKNFQNSLPNVVSIGSKGAGKTFNYIQLSRLRSWEDFLEKVDSSIEHNPFGTKALIFPLLQSTNLGEDAKNIIDGARQNVSDALGKTTLNFSFSGLRNSIIDSLSKNDWSEVDWANFWIQSIDNSITGECRKSNFHKLNNYLKEKDIKLIFLFDGLEDIFTEIATDRNQQKALRALLENLPNQLSEIRDAYFGLIIFLRRDFLRYTITQNSQQFENLYRAYDLSWNLNSFMRLSYWLCIQSQVIGAKLDNLYSSSIEELKEELEKLWGKKLGTDKTNEANSCNWIFAALTDFNGRLQARDIVRFLYHAASITLDNARDQQFSKWFSSRLLPPQAIRRALEPCSKDKVQEATEEYLIFKKWVDEVLPKYNPSDKKIPFSREQFEMDNDTVKVLDQMGVIYEDKDKDTAERYYMPEIFREGLGFSSKGARPRVLALKRKILGNL
jgi:MinD-like ATPase involved in chromosome partitioning or flagellar assembly